MPEIGDLLSRTACDWVGVPLTEREVAAVSRELQAMIRQAGHIARARYAPWRSGGASSGASVTWWRMCALAA